MNLLKKHWRGILARLPLPMLAIPASYGVYEFTALFVPTWVAIMQAAAFETVYVGLAAYDKLTNADKWRAMGISVFAVAASVVYNTLAGYFHRSPQALVSWESVWWGGLVLAALHGVPLALLAFFVSNFTLHRTPVDVESKEESLPTESLDNKPTPQPDFDRKRKPSLTGRIYVKVERKSAPQLPPPTMLSLAQLGFTEPQMQVLERVQVGMTQEAIAAELGLTRQAIADRLANAKKVSAKTVTDIQRQGKNASRKR